MVQWKRLHVPKAGGAYVRPLVWELDPTREHGRPRAVRNKEKDSGGQKGALSCPMNVAQRGKKKDSSSSWQQLSQWKAMDSLLTRALATFFPLL